LFFLQENDLRKALIPFIGVSLFCRHSSIATVLKYGNDYSTYQLEIHLGHKKKPLSSKLIKKTVLFNK